MVRAKGEEGSKEGLVRVSKINGSPRGWKSHLLQVLHSLSFRFCLVLAGFLLSHSSFELLNKKTNKGFCFFSFILLKIRILELKIDGFEDPEIQDPSWVSCETCAFTLFYDCLGFVHRSFAANLIWVRSCYV